jgi:hypothetical protein
MNEPPAASTGVNAVNLAPFPVPSTWTGKDGSVYTAVIKPKTGTTPGTFSVIPTSSVVFWLGCIGEGTARVASPSIGLHWSIPCGGVADPEGITFIPPRAAVGTSVKIKVTSSPHTRWEVRVDDRGTPPKTA